MKMVLVQKNANPLGDYNNSSADVQWQRGAFQYTSVVNPTVAGTGANVTLSNVVINAVLTEELWLSPLLFDNCEAPGLTGIKNMNFNFSLNTNLGAALWSSATQSGSTSRTITNIAVTFPSTPSLLFRFITPKLLDMYQPEPVYSLYNVERYTTDLKSVAAYPAPPVVYPTQNIQVNSIPNKIYIFARQQNADQTFNSTNSFLAISNVSISFDNRSGIMASASQSQLYQCSVRNGLQMTWSQFCGGPVWSFGPTGTPGTTGVGLTGSVLCLDPALDFGLNSVSSNGILSNINLQINVTLQNMNSVSALNATLYVVLVSEGSITIANGNVIKQIGVLTRDDVLNAKTSDYTVEDLKSSAYSGGSFLSTIKDIGRFVKDNKVVSRALGAYGKSGAPYSEVAGIGSSIADALGAGVVGGKRVHKRALRRRLM